MGSEVTSLTLQVITLISRNRTIFRAKLDVNRDVQEATQAEVSAVAAYNLYHGHIRRARECMGGGKGILFDIHGQVSIR